MKNLELSGTIELNLIEMTALDGGMCDPQDKKILGAAIAVAGTTCLAIAAGPVGWTLLVAGAIGMITE